MCSEPQINFLLDQGLALYDTAAPGACPKLVVTHDTILKNYYGHAKTALRRIAPKDLPVCLQPATAGPAAKRANYHEDWSNPQSPKYTLGYLVALEVHPSRNATNGLQLLAHIFYTPLRQRNNNWETLLNDLVAPAPPPPPPAPAQQQAAPQAYHIPVQPAANANNTDKIEGRAVFVCDGKVWIELPAGWRPGQTVVTDIDVGMEVHTHIPPNFVPPHQLAGGKDVMEIKCTMLGMLA